MRIVFDENIPPKIAEGMSLFHEYTKSKLNVDIVSIRSLGKLGISDEDVLNYVGENGFLISYDKDFKTHKKLKHVIKEKNIGVFWVLQEKQPHFFDLAKNLVNRWEAIIEIIEDEKAPFVKQVLKNGIKRIEL